VKKSGMVVDKMRGTVAGVAGKTFMAKKPVVSERPKGHLERPASQELAVGLKGKDCC